jgi:hypothetical protein
MPAGGILVIFVAVVLAIAIWQYQLNKKRRERLQQFALANRWSFVARDDSQCMRWQRPPFNEGFDRRALNVMTGHFRNHDMLAFDYTYKTRSTDGKGNSNTQTHHWRVCALALPTWLPYVEVGPENALTRLGNVMGVHDIELESEDFNRRFRVHANDPKAAYDVLSPRMLERLLALPPIHWRIDGNTILSWATGANDVTDLPARLSTLVTVVDGIPDFVWHDNGVPTANQPVAPPHSQPVAPPPQSSLPLPPPITPQAVPQTAPAPPQFPGTSA